MSCRWPLSVHKIPFRVLPSTDELQGMAESEIVNDCRPFQLQHPQRIRWRLGGIGGLSCAITDLAHGVARAVQRAGDLA